MGLVRAVLLMVMTAEIVLFGIGIVLPPSFVVNQGRKLGLSSTAEFMGEGSWVLLGKVY